MPNEFAHLPRIRVGDNFARRTPEGNLIETGWIDEDGVEHRDKEMVTGKDRIDPTNPAAMVPWDQQWR